MRNAFIQLLTELAGSDERILLLCMDLGYTVVEPFREAHPKRFFNTGVCEQSTLAMATGLAEGGFIPFVYTIATFATARPYEFIRNGPALHRLPVRVVGVGGGFEYGHAGPTHHSLDDIGLIRLLPGMTILAPADHQQARTCLRASWNRPGPVYYRLGKDEQYAVPGLNGAFDWGRIETVHEGRALCIVALGSLAREAHLAAELLAAQGVQATVLVVACLAPLPEQDLCAALARVPLVVTVEAHTAAGGLGECLGALIAANRLPCRLVRQCCRTPWDGISGSETDLLRRHQLDAPGITRAAQDALGAPPP